MASKGEVLDVKRSLLIQAPPARVLAAFFDSADLAGWWQVVRAVTVARPIGPMALEVHCRPHGNGRSTMLTVRQSGEGEGPRWARYFEIMGHGWEGALQEMKDYMDKEAERTKKQ